LGDIMKDQLDKLATPKKASKKTKAKKEGKNDKS